MRATLFAITALLTLLTPPALAQTPQWYRGALHAHATSGVKQLPTTSPDVVARWYREHGFHFVCLTDLNYVSPTEGLKALFDAPGRFLVMPGIELSVDGLQPGDKIVDTIGLGVSGKVAIPAGANPAEVLTAQARAIRAAGGLPIAAHPNLTWALTAAELASSDKTAGPRFFEVWNAEPGMNNAGGGGRPSTEQLWDAVLSTGRLLYGVAVDDSHHFSEAGLAREEARLLATPGRAWVMVRAAELSPKALRAALERGDFYATTGVVLDALEVTATQVRFVLSGQPRDLGWSAPGANPQRYRTEFIGKDGKVLAVDESNEPRYRFTGEELYVRARITSSDGLVAWTQPVFPPRGR